MAEAEGKCPGCDAAGPLGEACAEKGCTKRGYHFIPMDYWEAAHDDEGAHPDPVIGQLVGDFLAVAKIGAGGFGKVFLALQNPLFRLKGALKLIEFPSENVMLTQALLEKFQGEAEALADLTHPNIVRLLKYGTHNKQPYLVMEFVDQGRTLRQEIQRRARAKSGFEHSELQTIFDQVLNGLAAAHEQNIIHRDVKPENVMLQSVVGNPFHVRILDFGTAKFVENRADTKWPLGSPSYMAPEQVNLKGIGPWSDLYAVTVMIFELLTGRRPFPGSTENEIVKNKLDESFDPLLALERFDFPRVVHSFLEKGLQSDPEDRYRDAEELRQAMTEVFDALSEHPGTYGAQGVELTALLDSGDLMDVDQNAETKQASPPPIDDDISGANSVDSTLATREAGTGESDAESGDAENEASASVDSGASVPEAIVQDRVDTTAELTSADPEQTSRSRRSGASSWIYFVAGAVLLAVVLTIGYFVDQAANKKVSSAVLAASTHAYNSTQDAEVDSRLTASRNASLGAASNQVSLALEAAPVEPVEAEEPARLIQKVVAGKFHTCALVRSKVRCWGANFEGELGIGREGAIGDDEPAHRADWVEFDSPIVDVDASGDRQASYTCVRLENGKVRCWGANEHGQLGLGHTREIGKENAVTSVPPISLGASAMQIAVGASKFASHSCALLEGGDLRCWGGNNYGQLGLSHRTDVGDDEVPASVAPVSVGVDVARVFAGKYHTCVLSHAGAARCWGWNSQGQLGLGHTQDIGDDELPSASANVTLEGVTLVDLALGRRHTCSLDDRGKVRCWGWNSHGQLGVGHTRDIGDDEAVSEASAVELGAPATAVTTGANHSCALLESGAIRCWGDNRFGQLGYSHKRAVGDDESPSTVAAVFLGAPALALASGSYHNCAILEGDRMKCWGYNKFGQLGYGHTDTIGDTETPASAGDVPLLGPDEISEDGQNE